MVHAGGGGGLRSKSRTSSNVVFLCWSFLEVHIFATTYRKAFIVGPKVPYPTPPLYPTLPCHTLPYPTLPYPTLPYPTLPYPALTYPTLHLPLPYPTLPILILLHPQTHPQPHPPTQPNPTLPSKNSNSCTQPSQSQSSYAVMRQLLFLYSTINR